MLVKESSQTFLVFLLPLRVVLAGRAIVAAEKGALIVVPSTRDFRDSGDIAQVTKDQEFVLLA